MTTYTIKEVSELTGLSIPTLRYYEQIGLLDTVDRAANGHRRYTADDLMRLEFLMHVRATGMSIRQMQHFVNLHREGNETVPERLEVPETHRAIVQAQMEALSKTLDFLDAKIAIVREIGSHQHTPTTLVLHTET